MSKISELDWEQCGVTYPPLTSPELLSLAWHLSHSGRVSTLPDCPPAWRPILNILALQKQIPLFQIVIK